MGIKPKGGRQLPGRCQCALRHRLGERIRLWQPKAIMDRHGDGYGARAAKVGQPRPLLMATWRNRHPPVPGRHMLPEGRGVHPPEAAVQCRACLPRRVHRLSPLGDRPLLASDEGRTRADKGALQLRHLHRQRVGHFVEHRLQVKPLRHQVNFRGRRPQPLHRPHAPADWGGRT
jgi:hypothetical protein